MKIKDSVSVVIAYKISAIWYERANKVIKKHPNNERAKEIEHRLRLLAYRITEVQTAVFDFNVSIDRPAKPKGKLNIIEKINPIRALIDSKGGIWKPTHQDDWFDNGKYSIKIVDYTGFKIIKRGEPMPIVKKVIKEKPAPPEYRERKIDPNAFDDLRYEGL